MFYKYFHEYSIHPQFDSQHCQNNKAFQTDQSVLNSFLSLINSLPSFDSTAESPLHTKLVVMVLSALLGACVNLFHSLCRVPLRHLLFSYGEYTLIYSYGL